MKSKKGINLKNIYIGELVLIKEYKDNENVPSGQIAIGFSDNRTIAKLRIRKVVFVQGNEGTVLSYKLNKKNAYTYKVINPEQELDVKNNTLVIDNAKPVGDLLSFVGYKNVVKASDARKITKSLLSNDKEIDVLEHKLKLNGNSIISFSQIENINQQAEDLLLFKIRKMPTEEQEIEKAYVKHFKK